MKNKQLWFLRHDTTPEQDDQRLFEIGKMLAREVAFVDQDGYQCELLGACANELGDIAFVESRSKQTKKKWWANNDAMVDIDIRIHLRRLNQSEVSTPIETYNPYFGCDIHFFEAIESEFILIYTEKHSPYVCKFGKTWTPKFVKLNSYWKLENEVISHTGYKDETIQRLSIPAMNVLPPLEIKDPDSFGKI